MRKSPLIIATSIFLCSQGFAQEMRTFTDTKGRAIQAKVVSNTGDTVSLMLSSGKKATIPLSTLSTEDQAYIKDLKNQPKTKDDTKGKATTVSDADSSAAEQINSAIGFPAFNGQPFTQRAASDIAKALKMPVESNSSIGGSWRLYAAAKKKGYTLFDAIPYSVALYSDAAGNAKSMSIVFANKGDYNSKVGFGADHLKKTGEGKTSKVSLEDAMKNDFETIKLKLTDALGQPKKAYYGDSGTRNGVSRWDWNGHSFLLSLVKKEYVSVSIVSPKQADTEGRSTTIDDASIKSRIKGAIKKDENGDVYITDIPMVDQGPKGYCVPATFERAMRFMGLEADMYLLAMLGESSQGGTSVDLLVDNTKSIIMRKGARVKEIKGKKVSISLIKKNIDQGIPMLWTMASGNPYNDPTNENTKLRNKAGHSEHLAKQEKIYDDKKKPKINHVCMIIGYNEKTEEVAVSDSWGKRYAVRWTPLSVAEWASSGRFVTIQP